MAGKKTGKRKRRKSQLRVFVVSLLIVLFAGSVAMLAYSETRTPKTTKSPIIMDFDGLSQTEYTDYADDRADADITDVSNGLMSEETDIEAGTQEQATAVDEMLAENERLYKIGRASCRERV